MTVKKDELMTIPWTAGFKEKLILEDNIDLLLNKVSVYGCVKSDSLGSVIDKKVNFEIKVINNKRVIYPLADYDTYFLHGERIVKATIVEIKALDYITNFEYNGDFTFVLKGENNK